MQSDLLSGYFSRAPSTGALAVAYHLCDRSYSYSPLKLLRYGPGSISSLPDVLKQLGVNRALILTGNSISKSPLLEKVRSAIGADMYAGVNSGIGQHAPIAGINAALKQVEESGVDAIIALGGGSPIDSAKAISYFRNEKSKLGYLPIIAIPTTLSVAETSQGAGYTNDAGDKVLLNNIHLTPQAIILDAEVTKYTPQKLWISSGMRAVDHAVEALYPSNPPKFLIVQNSLIALPLLFEYLLKCHADPENIEYRQTLQLAAFHSLFPNPSTGALGLSHALGHGLGAKYSIPHGITSCLTLAGVVAITARATSPSNRARLSQALKALKIADLGGLQPSQRFITSAEDAKIDGVVLSGYIDALVEKVGLRTRFEDWKVPTAHFSGMVDKLESIGFVGKENKPSKEDAQKLLEVL